MRLILIRHGESEHAIRRVISGQVSCRGLTKGGFHQVGVLANRFRTTGEVSDCHALLSSPVLRAQQSAEVLASMALLGPIEQESDLCELLPGAADGLSWQAYRSSYTAFNLLTSPTRPFAPRGESWQDFMTRVRTTLEYLAARFAGQTVIAVTHAGCIVASLLVVFDIPRPGTGARVDPDYTSLTKWSATKTTWQLVRFNDTSHLTKDPPQ